MISRSGFSSRDVVASAAAPSRSSTTRVTLCCVSATRIRCTSRSDTGITVMPFDPSAGRVPIRSKNNRSGFSSRSERTRKSPSISMATRVISPSVQKRTALTCRTSAESCAWMVADAQLNKAARRHQRAPENLGRWSITRLASLDVQPPLLIPIAADVPWFVVVGRLGLLGGYFHRRSFLLRGALGLLVFLADVLHVLHRFRIRRHVAVLGDCAL